MKDQLVSQPTKRVFEADQFRNLRARLLFPSSGPKPKSIAITSPGVKEGKSFIAANLAVSFAQNVDNRQILLIDCDVQRPSIHKFFGLNGSSPGLSEYLSKEIDLSDLLLKPSVENLTILPGGTPPDNPTELLSSQKMLNLLTEVQKIYNDRYVIMDLPPPTLVTESSALARQSEGIILVVRYGKTPNKDAIKLVDLLGKDRVLGVVLNRFDTSRHSAMYRMYSKFVRR